MTLNHLKIIKSDIWSIHIGIDAAVLNGKEPDDGDYFEILKHLVPLEQAIDSLIKKHTVEKLSSQNDDSQLSNSDNIGEQDL